MSGPVVRADPVLRRHVGVAVAVVAAAVLGGFIGVGVWRDSLEALGRESPSAAAEQAERGLRVATIGIGALALICALYVYRLARRVRDEGRWPPQGMRVIRDTRVIAGQAARRLGVLGMVMAGLLVALGLLIPLLIRVAISPVFAA
jgi:ABC-type Fe3+ transport system permease subunit